MNELHAQRHGDITISTDKSQLDVDVIHGFLRESYWSKNIPRAVVENGIAHAICFGVYDHALPLRENGLPQQVGFARVITDQATFAYLADVFILETQQGKGLGKLLMRFIMQLPELQGLRRFMLATRDAHTLYAQYGFTPVSMPDRLMEISRPGIYEQP